MDTMNREKYMLGILYLMILLSNKRKGIIENIIPFKDKKTLDNIIASVDILANIEYSNLSKGEDYLVYEEALGKYLNTIIKSNGLNTDDEQVLIKKSEDASLNEFRGVELSIDPQVKDLLKKIGITISGIHSWFQSPDFVRKFTIHRGVCYLCTKKISVRGKSKILFYHLSVSPSLIEKKYAIHTALLLDIETYEQKYSSPIRVFLSILNKYGLPINVRNTTKKFFLSITGDMSLITSIYCQLTEDSYLNMEGNGNVFIFIYAINTGKYVQDYRYKMT